VKSIFNGTLMRLPFAPLMLAPIMRSDAASAASLEISEYHGIEGGKRGVAAACAAEATHAAAAITAGSMAERIDCGMISDFPGMWPVR
jgi:hypothetical protein